MSKNGNLLLSEINEKIKLIAHTDYYYVGSHGNIYRYTPSNHKYLKLRLTINRHNHYVYCGIRYREKATNRTRRVHRLVAQAFIPNPNQLPIVGHKDNNKHNNNVQNLYWTTVKDNTQKAFDDRLEINDKGIIDSQSQPIACYRNNHTLVGVYGSIGEAARCINGFSKSSIAKVLNQTTHGRKGYYFKPIPKETYQRYPDQQAYNFTVNYIPKHRKTFNVYQYGKYLFTSNNQKQTAIKLQISQANISHRLKNQSLKPLGNGYTFKLVNS